MVLTICKFVFCYAEMFLISFIRGSSRGWRQSEYYVNRHATGQAGASRESRQSLGQQGLSAAVGHPRVDAQWI
jgi:hypothetical protein